jgi:DNA polymerase, archaea type
LTLARKIEMLDDGYRVYNVDVPPVQSYLYEHNIFPLAFCEVDNHCSKLRWLNKDSIWSTDYKIPDFISFDCKPKEGSKNTKIHR